MFGGANFMLHKKHDNILVKKQREQNKILYLNSRTFLDKFGQMLPVNESKVSIEPALVTKFKPLKHSTIVNDKNVFNKYSYGTELFRFFDLTLYSLTKGRGNKKVSNYELIKSTYLDQRFDFLDSEFNYLNYNEVVYPGGQNTYRAQVRTRTNFSFDTWKNARDARAITDYVTAYGYTLPLSSIWNLDAELPTAKGPAYPLTASLPTLSSASQEGELQNHRNLFHRTRQAGSNSQIVNSPLYARPILSGGFDTQFINKYVVGITPWDTPTGASASPYVYSESSYDERIRLVGKDYSIVPEFRISNHIDEIVNNSNDYLRDFDKYFDLLGAEANVSSSNSSQFFNTYMHSDFLQYFDVIQKEHSGVGETDEIEINCNALMKFLPYEGFYPAQRTRDIANLLSSSYSDAMQQDSASFRTFQQPFFGPGILYNSIKSGLSLAHPVCTRALGPEDLTPSLFRGVSNAVTGKFILIDGTALFQDNFKYVPFESLLEPEKFINSANGLGTIYDMETVYEAASNPVGSGSLTGAFDNRYKLAINNFLAETMNMFIDPVESGFMFSLPENRFGDFVPGQVYSMQVTFNKELENYSRASAYGPAISETTIGTTDGDSYDMFLPPYNRAEQAGQADQRSLISWKLHMTASAASMTADEILSAMTSSYIKTNGIAATLDSTTEIQDYFIAPEQCFNLTKVAVATSTSRTNSLTSLSSDGTPVHSIMIQPKWQAPILDFTGVTASIPAGADPAMYSVGMWHQYGQLPGKKGTVRVSISSFASETDNELSLADKLGLTGQSIQLGRIKKSFEVKEAIMAIPFIDGADGCPQYFKINHNIIKDAQSQFNGELLAENREFKAGSSVVDMVSKMGDYVIPPKFDFLTFKEVDPMAMYIFEFSHKFSQKDLSNIWQNVSPTDGALDGDITNSFKTAGVNIKHKINNSENTVEKVGFEFPAFSPSVKNNNVRWLVFKVKQKAKKDYYDTLANIPRQNPDVVKLYPSIERVNYPNRNINSPVSYNWPYDYFSMVELVKLDTNIKINKKNEEA
jgi:hypothetical protein